MAMKGIILAGGTGSRLDPLTKITNKHLLPVYDRPMIYYSIEAMVNASVTDIMIVTGGEGAGDFLRLLGNGAQFGLKHLNYTYQEEPGGIAQALGLCEHFARGERVLVMLGDNIIERHIGGAAKTFERQASGAKVILSEVDNPGSYGIAQLDGEKIVGIEEKPTKPLSNWAVIGMYFYDERVFDIIKTLKPSARGELEITDVNNEYVRLGEMTFEYLEGWWGDAGESIDWLRRANNLVAESGANLVD
jgi:glucose-1-phosphate thymidylyltransferase